MPAAFRDPRRFRLRLRGRRLVPGALVVVTALLAAGCDAPDRPAANPADAAQVAQGRRVYDAHCASCHGPNLEGQPEWQTRRPDGRLPAPPHDPSGHTWHHPDAVLFAITRDGLTGTRYAPPGYQSDMPAFRDRLSDGEIHAVLAYIKSTWPADVLAKQRAIDRASRRQGG